MNGGAIVLILILTLIVFSLIIYNLSLYKKIKQLSNTNQKVSNLAVLQNFIETIGKDIPADEKIKTINDIVIEKYGIKYSSIVVFNGVDYILKASNVDERFAKVLTNLHNDDMFKDSILSATPKYVTINNASERLSYQKNEMSRSKSAMFFPLYIDNIYIGYWIIESDQMHAFDKMDTSILRTIKDNIISVLKTVSYQNTIENIFREDLTTGLYSAEYLYGKGKTIIDKYDESSICMFTINNIESINENYGRNIGTDTIKKVADIIKDSISSEYLFVRYMGPKFAIVFTGINIDAVPDFVKSIKEEVENIEIPTGKIKSKQAKKEIYASPKTKFVIATYYKGTGIEELTKKLESYLDESDKEDSKIVCI